ncbi:hypothetical protein NDU88_005472 [Pleurodeles waltl]|uniref:Uncharacterized protein n=1 Tax=Pleurodeles waltl TaxID=8319 RepID=A0AAV7VL67_PLEWA|nr:hypothetical protein NDU88_005472 [Pleurodeles waltl]
MCRPIQILNVGGGAAANSRSSLSGQALARPAPASGGGPGRKRTSSRARGSAPEGHPGSGSPAGERSLSLAPGKGQSAPVGQSSVLALARPKFGPAGDPRPTHGSRAGRNAQARRPGRYPQAGGRSSPPRIPRLTGRAARPQSGRGTRRSSSRAPAGKLPVPTRRYPGATAPTSQ